MVAGFLGAATLIAGLSATATSIAAAHDNCETKTFMAWAWEVCWTARWRYGRKSQPVHSAPGSGRSRCAASDPPVRGSPAIAEKDSAAPRYRPSAHAIDRSARG